MRSMALLYTTSNMYSKSVRKHTTKVPFTQIRYARHPMTRTSVTSGGATAVTLPRPVACVGGCDLGAGGAIWTILLPRSTRISSSRCHNIAGIKSSRMEEESRARAEALLLKADWTYNVGFGRAGVTKALEHVEDGSPFGLWVLHHLDTENLLTPDELTM